MSSVVPPVICKACATAWIAVVRVRAWFAWWAVSAPRKPADGAGAHLFQPYSYAREQSCHAC